MKDKILELQNKINEVYKYNFGYTPLSECLNDIQRETLELFKWTDIKNLKEEASDLLGSIVMLCNESRWTIEELINMNVNKIQSRSLQYRSLGRKSEFSYQNKLELIPYIPFER